MARVNKKELKGLKLYNYLLKRLGEENKKLPKKLKLGISQKRKIVSETLYPKFKNKPISLTEISKSVKSQARKLPPSEICNPLYLSDSYLSFVEFFEIDNHIKSILPPCLDVKVNAGIYGKTKIFNTSTYSYYSDGVRTITEAIRHKLAHEKSGIAYYNGVRKLKPRKKNDGNPNNYYIEYVLYINDSPEDNDEPVTFDLPKKEEKKKYEVKKYMNQQFKELEKEKRKRKSEYKKKKLQQPQEKKKFLSEKVKDAIASLKALQKAGIITKEQFNEQKSSILKLKK